MATDDSPRIALRAIGSVTGSVGLGGRETHMNLWLDDIRPPLIGYVWAKTAKEAIAYLSTGTVQRASLDHDLSIEATLGNWRNEITGYDVVLWMEKNNVWPKNGVAVHSLNPVGKERMMVVINNHYGK
jgi:hypothetical protein